MNVFDPVIFHIFIFLPLVAAVFITLIPAGDVNSKHTVSKFFAGIGFLLFIRLFLVFVEKKIPTETSLSLAIANFNINFLLNITKYNIFLYGISSAILLAYMFSYKRNDTKTNIHQVAAFILTFLLNVSLGQTDLRVALPILSIANFLIYFLIGFTDNIRRGSTIFQMGIFLFSCDALALVLLQIPFSDDLSPPFIFANIFLLVPGLTRLSIPTFAPFMKKLILNVDDYDGPFFMVFLHLSGFFILIMTRFDLVELPESMSVGLGSTVLLGAIITSFLAVNDYRIKTLPYYLLIFHSSLAAFLLFVSHHDDTWFFVVSLLLSNIVCFFNAARIVPLVSEVKIDQYSLARLRSTWFIMLFLHIGLPGLGQGFAFSFAAYHFMTLGLINDAGPKGFFFRLLAFLWIMCCIVFAYAALISVRSEMKPIANQRATGMRVVNSLNYGSWFVVVISWLLPAIIFYAKTKI